MENASVLAESRKVSKMMHKDFAPFNYIVVDRLMSDGSAQQKKIKVFDDNREVDGEWYPLNLESMGISFSGDVNKWLDYHNNNGFKTEIYNLKKESGMEYKYKIGENVYRKGSDEVYIVKKTGHTKENPNSPMYYIETPYGEGQAISEDQIKSVEEGYEFGDDMNSPWIKNLSKESSSDTSKTNTVYQDGAWTAVSTSDPVTLSKLAQGSEWGIRNVDLAEEYLRKNGHFIIIQKNGSPFVAIAGESGGVWHKTDSDLESESFYGTEETNISEEDHGKLKQIMEKLGRPLKSKDTKNAVQAKQTCKKAKVFDDRAYADMQKGCWKLDKESSQLKREEEKIKKFLTHGSSYLKDEKVLVDTVFGLREAKIVSILPKAKYEVMFKDNSEISEIEESDIN